MCTSGRITAIAAATFEVDIFVLPMCDTVVCVYLIDPRS